MGRQGRALDARRRLRPGLADPFRANVTETGPCTSVSRAPRRTNRVRCPRLANHQTGPVQDAAGVGLDNGPVHRRVHPEIICDEKHFSVAYV